MTAETSPSLSAAAPRRRTAGTSRHAASPTPRRGLALVVIAAAQLMVVLDGTITNIALPSIQAELDVSASNLAWIVNSYALAFGALLLLGGKSGDLFGRRRMSRIGIAVFTIASVLGGFATNEAWLIAARVLQGIGGAIAALAAGRSSHALPRIRHARHQPHPGREQRPDTGLHHRTPCRSSIFRRRPGHHRARHQRTTCSVRHAG